MSPLTNAAKYKRTIAQVLFHLDICISRLEIMDETIAEFHPELAEILSVTTELLDLADTDLLYFWVRTWGSLPEDVDVYRR